MSPFWAVALVMVIPGAAGRAAAAFLASTWWCKIGFIVTNLETNSRAVARSCNCTPMEGAAQFRKVNSADQPITSPVLVVDLDGTCMKTNLPLESLLALLQQKPQYVFVLPL